MMPKQCFTGSWCHIGLIYTVIRLFTGHQLPNTGIVSLYQYLVSTTDQLNNTNMYVLVWFRYLEPHAIFRYTWSRYLRPRVYWFGGIDMCSCIWVCFFSAHGTIIRYHVREKELQRFTLFSHLLLYIQISPSDAIYLVFSILNQFRSERISNKS